MRNIIQIISLIALIIISSCNSSSQYQEDFELNNIEDLENSGVIKEVKIQNQIWSKRNINITRFIDGREIKYCKSCEELQSATENQIPAYCYLNFNIDNAYLGKYYNYYAIIDSVGLAPKGWRIPSANDFINLAKEHGELKKNDWGLIEYEFKSFSFKVQHSEEKNAKPIGFDAFLLGSGDIFDCKIVEGVSDFWTNTSDSSKFETNIYGDTLYERVNDVKYQARFQDNTDENLTFESEGFFILGAATNDALMVLRLIKLK